MRGPVGCLSAKAAVTAERERREDPRYRRTLGTTRTAVKKELAAAKKHRAEDAPTTREMVFAKTKGRQKRMRTEEDGGRLRQPSITEMFPPVCAGEKRASNGPLTRRVCILQDDEVADACEAAGPMAVPPLPGQGSDEALPRMSADARG